MSQVPQLTTLNHESTDQSQKRENSSLLKAADWLRAPSAGKGNYPLLPERSFKTLLGCAFPLSVSVSGSKSKVQSSEEGREDLGQEDVWEEQQGWGAHSDAFGSLILTVPLKVCFLPSFLQSNNLKNLCVCMCVHLCVHG